MWDIEKSVLREKYIAMSAYITNLKKPDNAPQTQKNKNKPIPKVVDEKKL
jgi:hypothetical protein